MFHQGYFKHVVNLLQSICKECARLLLPDGDERQKFVKLMKSRSDPIEKEGIRE